MSAIEFNHISKQYRLGLVSTRTLSHDLNRWWTMNILRKEDPYLKIGETNNRATKGDSEYVWALRDIDFKVEQGDVLGIIGKNGAGKSTLLKILSRVTTPTTGSIKAKGRIASLLEVGTGFHPEMTGRENIYMNGAIMGMTKAEISRKLEEIVDFSGCERYLDTPVKRYSSGMTVRLGFAIAAHLEPEILVVDEVLAVGDAEFQKKAIGKMQDVSKGEGRTVLFVSHNMASMRQLCTKGVLLENGGISYMGDIDDTIDHYLNSNIPQLGNGTIFDSIKIFSPKVEDVIININGQESSILQVKSGESLNFSFKGVAKEKIKIAPEIYLLTKEEVKIAVYSKGLCSGEISDVEPGEFELTQTITLPSNLAKGEYYLTLDLTHPFYEYYMRAIESVKLEVEGYSTITGLAPNANIYGFLIFD